MACITNIMHASTCPWLWLWYDEVMGWSIISCLQNLSKLSTMKFMLGSETIFFGSANSKIPKSIIHNSASLFMENKSALTTSQGLYSILCGIFFSYDCICWYSRHVAHCFTVFWCLYSYSPSMLTHALRDSSFLCLYGCCVNAVLSAYTVEME